MKRYVIFETEKGNRYLYSDKMQSSVLMPPLLEKIFKDLSISMNKNDTLEYYKRKCDFLKKNGIEQFRRISFITKPSPEVLCSK